MLNFTQGFVYGTNMVDNTTAFDNCILIIDDAYVYNAEYIYNRTMSNWRDGKVNGSIFNSIYAFYDMIWNLHPLFMTCRDAPDNSISNTKARFNDQSDLRVILTNIVGHTAFMVETSKDVLDFFRSSD